VVKVSGLRLHQDEENAILELTLAASFSLWEKSPNEFASGAVMTAVTCGPFALMSYPASVEDAGAGVGTPMGQSEGATSKPLDLPKSLRR